MSKLKTITLSATKGDKTIANAKDVFSYIDSDFKNWNTDKKDKATKKQNADVYELEKDSTFAQIFTEPEKMCLTQEQIIDFCKNYKGDLRQDGYATLFLFKVDFSFFVARVNVLTDGLGVNVIRFSRDLVWHAECRHRFVTPATDSLKPSDTDSLNLSNFVAELKSLIKKYE